MTCFVFVLDEKHPKKDAKSRSESDTSIREAKNVTSNNGSVKDQPSDAVNKRGAKEVTSSVDQPIVTKPDAQRRSPPETVSDKLTVASSTTATATTISPTTINSKNSPTTEATAAAAPMPTRDPNLPSNDDHQRTKIDVDRMQEVADDMVEKLIMDDELLVGQKKSKLLVGSKLPTVNTAGLPISTSQQPPPPLSSSALGEESKNIAWYYRDPQDQVQGPFSAVEMAEWYQAGYFDDSLCVRRANDQRYSKLGDLIEMCAGDMPFFASYRVLPIQLAPSPASGPSPAEMMLQQQQQQHHQQQLKNPLMAHKMNPMIDVEARRLERHNYLLRQQASVHQKLSTSEVWHMLSPDQQQQMINKHVAQLIIPDNIYGLQASSVAADSGPMVGPPFGGLMELMNKPPTQPPPSSSSTNPMVDGTDSLANHALLQQHNLLHEKKMHLMQGPPGGSAMMGHFSGAVSGQQQLPPEFGGGALGAGHMPPEQLMHNFRMFPQPSQAPHSGPALAPPPGPPNPLHSLPPNQMPGGGQPPPQSSQQTTPADLGNNERIRSLLMQLHMQKEAHSRQQPPQQPVAIVVPMAQHLQKQTTIPWLTANDALKNATAAGMNMHGNGIGMGGGGGGIPVNSQWMDGVNGPPNVNNIGGLETARPGGGGIWDLQNKLYNNSANNLAGGQPPKHIEMRTEKQILEEQHLIKLMELERQEKAMTEHMQQQQQQQHQQNNITQQQQQQEQEQQLNDANQWNKVESKQQNNQKGGRRAEDGSKKKDASNAKGGNINNNNNNNSNKKMSSDLDDHNKKVKNMEEVNNVNNGTNKKQKDASQKSSNSAEKKQQQDKESKHNNKNLSKSTTKSVAPWSTNNPAAEMTGLSLTEIQKLELEQQRAEQSRLEQVMIQQQQQQWFDMTNLKNDMAPPKWNAPQMAPSVVKSLAEIQAEELAKMRQWSESQQQQQQQNQSAVAQSSSTATKVTVEEVLTNPQGLAWNSMKIWGGPPPPTPATTSSGIGGFWDEPAAKGGVIQSQSTTTMGGIGSSSNARSTAGKTIAKSQTMSNIISQKPSASPAASTATAAKGVNQKQSATAANRSQQQQVPSSGNSNNGKKEAHKTGRGGGNNSKKDDASGQEFTAWCMKTLSAMNTTVDSTYADCRVQSKGLAIKK